MNIAAQRSLLLRLPRCLAFLGLASVGLIGCAPVEEQHSAELDWEDEETRKIYMRTLETQGVELFCGSAEYIACFDSTDKQCIKELTPLVANCLRDQEAKFENASTERMYREATNDWVACIMLSHLSLRPHNASETSQCVGNIQFDEEEIKKRLREKK